MFIKPRKAAKSVSAALTVTPAQALAAVAAAAVADAVKKTNNK